MKIEAGKYYKTAKGNKVGPAEVSSSETYPWNSLSHYPEDNIVSEWIEEEPEEMTYKTWGEMAPEEKGALLLAHYEGKTIQWSGPFSPEEWSDDPEPFVYTTLKFRVKPQEPKIEEKVFDEVYLNHGFPYTFITASTVNTKGTATVTYTDGKPIKMVWECDSTAV